MLGWYDLMNAHLPRHSQCRTSTMPAPAAAMAKEKRRLEAGTGDSELLDATATARQAVIAGPGNSQDAAALPAEAVA